MFRLFRRLRQRLLFNHKFDKYFFYAVGEIFIVFLGILIALQVNNWNERRKKRNLEITILKAIKTDLEQDINEWNIDIGVHNEALTSIPIVIDHLAKELPHTDTLDYHFLTSTVTSAFSYHSGALETLKSTGINILTNEELRIEIVDIYTNWYYYMTLLSKHLTDWHYYGVKNIFISRFIQAHDYDDYTTKKLWDGEMVPLDYDSLVHDDEYMYYLLTFKNDTIFYLNALLVSKQRVRDLIARIDSEIQKLEKS